MKKMMTKFLMMNPDGDDDEDNTDDKDDDNNHDLLELEYYELEAATKGTPTKLL
jgi:hypothetical protein